ncbi:MAG: hypothetical protein ACQKBW_06240 [Puniceicoccales bacterium]
MIKTPSILLAGLALAFTTSASAVTLTFDNQTVFDQQWSSVTSNPESTATLQTDPDRLRMYATDPAGAVSQLTLYTTAGLSSDMDFISSAKNFTFNNINLTYTSTGATYSGNFGVSNDNSGGLQQNSGPDNAVFLTFNRFSAELQLRMKYTDTLSTLETWSFTPSTSTYSLSSVTMTLSDSAWAITGQTSDGQDFSGSGSYTDGITWSSQNWGEDFYTALQVLQTTTSDTRYSQLEVESITAENIPEAETSALLLGLSALLFLWMRRRR